MPTRSVKRNVNVIEIFRTANIDFDIFGQPREVAISGLQTDFAEVEWIDLVTAGCGIVSG